MQFDPDEETYSIPVGEGMPRSNENYTIQIAGLNRWRGDQIRKLDILRETRDPLKRISDEEYEKLKDGIEASYRDQAEIFGGLDVSGVSPGDFPDIVGGYEGEPGTPFFREGGVYEQGELDAYAPPVPPPANFGGGQPPAQLGPGATPPVKAQGEGLLPGQ